VGASGVPRFATRRPALGSLLWVRADSAAYEGMEAIFQAVPAYLSPVYHGGINAASQKRHRTSGAAGDRTGYQMVFCVRMGKRKMVRAPHEFGAIDVETHLRQLWGQCQPFNGADSPSFQPQTR